MNEVSLSENKTRFWLDINLFLIHSSSLFGTKRKILPGRMIVDYRSKFVKNTALNSILM